VTRIRGLNNGTIPFSSCSLDIQAKPGYDMEMKNCLIIYAIKLNYPSIQLTAQLLIPV
jgi:hypothetical protein